MIIRCNHRYNILFSLIMVVISYNPVYATVLESSNNPKVNATNEVTHIENKVKNIKFSPQKSNIQLKYIDKFQETEIETIGININKLKVYWESGLNWEGKENNFNTINHYSHFLESESRVDYLGIFYFLGIMTSISIKNNINLILSYRVYRYFAHDWDMENGILIDRRLQTNFKYSKVFLSLSYIF